jgi:GAF domain-containing protein
MTDKPPAYENIYHNAVTSVAHEPSTLDDKLAADVNYVLTRAAELARVLIGAHQSAIALIARKDWISVRKYFSLSSKYQQWADYSTPAVGVGIHAWMLDQKGPVRLTQAELEAHPAWIGFGTEKAVHPPMRGWLAVPLLDHKGVCWGLFQLSDKYEGDFTAADEVEFTKLAELVSVALDALWQVHDQQMPSA